MTDSGPFQYSFCFQGWNDRRVRGEKYDRFIAKYIIIKYILHKYVQTYCVTDLSTLSKQIIRTVSSTLKTLVLTTLKDC